MENGPVLLKEVEANQVAELDARPGLEDVSEYRKPLTSQLDTSI
jgi:hypothetical protein